MVNSVYKSLNKNINLRYIEMPENIKNQYQYHTQANLSKLRKLGYKKNFYSLEEGIKDYINILKTYDSFS